MPRQLRKLERFVSAQETTSRRMIEVERLSRQLVQDWEDHAAGLAGRSGGGVVSDNLRALSDRLRTLRLAFVDLDMAREREKEAAK